MSDYFLSTHQRTVLNSDTKIEFTCAPFPNLDPFILMN